MAWKLNEKGDIILENHIVETKTLKEEVIQRIYLKLSLFNGEWYLHENDGLDWLNDYNKIGQIGKRIKEFNIKEQIKQTILADKYIKNLLNFDVIFDNENKGVLNINCSFILNNGELVEFR